MLAIAKKHVSTLIGVHSHGSYTIFPIKSLHGICYRPRILSNQAWRTATSLSSVVPAPRAAMDFPQSIFGVTDDFCWSDKLLKSESEFWMFFFLVFGCLLVFLILVDLEMMIDIVRKFLNWVWRWS